MFCEIIVVASQLAFQTLNNVQIFALSLTHATYGRAFLSECKLQLLDGLIHEDEFAVFSSQLAFGPLVLLYLLNEKVNYLIGVDLTQFVA